MKNTLREYSRAKKAELHGHSQSVASEAFKHAEYGATGSVAVILHKEEDTFATVAALSPTEGTELTQFQKENIHNRRIHLPHTTLGAILTENDGYNQPHKTAMDNIEGRHTCVTPLDYPGAYIQYAWINDKENHTAPPQLDRTAQKALSETIADLDTHNSYTTASELETAYPSALNHLTIGWDLMGSTQLITEDEGAFATLTESTAHKVLDCIARTMPIHLRTTIIEGGGDGARYTVPLPDHDPYDPDALRHAYGTLNNTLARLPELEPRLYAIGGLVYAEKRQAKLSGIVDPILWDTNRTFEQARASDTRTAILPKTMARLASYGVVVEQ